MVLSRGDNSLKQMGGKRSQGLGEAEKGDTGELVAGKNTGYCNGEKKLPYIFLCSGPCLARGLRGGCI